MCKEFFTFDEISSDVCSQGEIRFVWTTAKCLPIKRKPHSHSEHIGVIIKKKYIQKKENKERNEVECKVGNVYAYRKCKRSKRQKEIIKKKSRKFQEKANKKKIRK